MKGKIRAKNAKCERLILHKRCFATSSFMWNFVKYRLRYVSVKK